MRDGVDVKLDKWDLKEGHDLNAFMESMVHDPAITKVIMVFDREYSQRADDKQGGVGTETQIISTEVYKSVQQDKFVGVVRERDDSGEACVPIYYRGRKYIDLSDDSSYHDQYEMLLRWIYNKPLHKKPEIGSKPAFLDDESSSQISSSLSSAFRSAVDAIKKNKPNAPFLAKGYIDILVSELSRYPVKPNGEQHLDDQVISRIEEMRLLRNQVLDFFSHVVRFQSNGEVLKQVHSFFERSIAYSMADHSAGSHQPAQFDNYKFFLYELFLYFSAMMIKEEKFSELNDFLKKEYYSEGLEFYSRADAPLADFSFFYRDMESLEHRNNRLGLRRVSLVADLIKDNVEEAFVHHRDLVQADLVLYIRSLVRRTKTGLYCFWFPVNLVYFANSFGCPFEAFLKSRDVAFFERFKVLMLVGSKEELMDQDKYPDLFSNHRLSPGMMGSINISRSCGLDNWSTIDE